MYWESTLLPGPAWWVSFKALAMLHTSLSSCGVLIAAAAAAAKLLQSCPTLCDSIVGSPPGSPVPGILQARTLEWVAISLSDAWKWKVKVKLLSRVLLLATPWTAAYQAPPSMGFSRQEYWSGVPLPSPAHHCWKSAKAILLLWKRLDPSQHRINKFFLVSEY